jgi:hypothetical protein
MTLALATGLSLLLAGIAGLHAYWGLGGLWPAGSEQELLRTVIGDARRRRMPSPPLCGLVAAALLACALWPPLLVAVPPGSAVRPLVVACGFAIAAVFALRGAAGFVPAWRRMHPLEPFAGYDRRYYSPLCLLIAGGYAVLLLQGP